MDTLLNNRVLNNGAASADIHTGRNEFGPPSYPLNKNQFHEVFLSKYKSLKKNTLLIISKQTMGLIVKCTVVKPPEEENLHGRGFSDEFLEMPQKGL